MVPESLILVTEGWNRLMHKGLRRAPARGKACSRWLFLSLIIFIWSSVLPMYSWLRLLVEVISFWGFVLGTEGGTKRICQCLHSCTSFLHFVCIENVSTSQGCRIGVEKNLHVVPRHPANGSLLRTKAKQPHIWVGNSHSKYIHLSAPTYSTNSYSVSISEKSKIQAHSVVTAYLLGHRESTSWVTDSSFPRSQAAHFLSHRQAHFLGHRQGLLVFPYLMESAGYLSGVFFVQAKFHTWGGGEQECPPVRIWESVSFHNACLSDWT